MSDRGDADECFSREAHVRLNRRLGTHAYARVASCASVAGHRFSGEAVTSLCTYQAANL